MLEKGLFETNDETAAIQRKSSGERRLEME